MLHGPLTKKLIQFAIPVALTSMLQQLFHAADTSVVGHFADANALAAVGTNGELIALLVPLSAGLSAGANVEIARCIGEKKTSLIPEIIQTALTFALFFGCLGAIPGQFFAAPVLSAIKTPASVLQPAVSYLRIYFLGYPFLLLYDFGSAILRAKGDSRYPFFALLVSGILNAACTRILLVLVFEPVCGLYEIPAGVLRGIGHSTLPAVFTVIGTCLLRIIWIFTVFSRFHTPQSLFLVFPVSWVVTILLVGSELFRFLEIRSLP